MHIHLEQLPHQEAAIASVLKAMEHCLESYSDSIEANSAYANPKLHRIQNIDVKMETGTGKTYVYTRLMHELYRHFGINKYIILTPSLAIKEGTRSFIRSDYATQHFRELFRSQKINTGVVNAGDFTTNKGKRKQFASALVDFCEASKSDIGTINALLLNDAMLASKSMTRDDYDQTLIGSSSCPIEALKLTRPVVIIDEPHRFKKDGAAWANVIKLNPQLIIRFGATFPDKFIGSGRSKIVKKDYDNLVYDLNAVESFNQGLVKAIDINYPRLSESQANQKYKVESATSKELTLSRDGRKWVINTGDDLSIIDSSFDGDTTYEGKKLSNELEVAPGMILTPSTWKNSYQELMIQQAIEAHFIKERELFSRPLNAPRVKVLSLYFIDSIPSYRDPDGWLKKTFERLLNRKLDALIASEEGDYKDFLVATKASLSTEDQKVHAGYFAEDSAKKGDEAIQDEVNDILRNKESLLQFKDENGNWNTRRFLFSKWTLREGWDNPNVFVLAKLRSSGSESSKIQEVGRGLRLPVDELGNRLSSDEFRLYFLVDYSEKNFAKKLVGEINADGGILRDGKITDNLLDELVKAGYADSISKVKGKLLLGDIIDSSDTVIDQHKLESLIPLGVKPAKIRDNINTPPTVRLRKHNWKKVRSLWEAVSKRFMLRYDSLDDEEVKQLLQAILPKNVFSNSSGRVTQFSTQYDPELKAIKLFEKTITLDFEYGHIKYGDFIKRIHEMTSLPVNLIHKSLIIALKDVTNPSRKFNDNTLNNIQQAFTAEFLKRYCLRYEYDPLDFNATVSIFDSNGTIKDEISQGAIGLELAKDINVPENYLYDEIAYDSELEHQILKESSPNEVLVFGKLPRRSIKIPTYLGGTTSPDFIYAIREANSSKIKVYALIEAKGKKVAAITPLEQAAIEAQEKISSNLKNVEVKMVTDSSAVGRLLRELI